MSAHSTKCYTLNGNRNDAKAVCPCGWFTFGTLVEVQTAAASHDIDEWQAVEVTAQPAVVSP